MFITNDYLQCKFYTLLCCFEIFFKDINGVFSGSPLERLLRGGAR